MKQENIRYQYFRRETRFIPVVYNKYFKRYLQRVLTCLATIIVFVMLFDAPLLHKFELVIFDTFFSLRKVSTEHASIAFIEIAEDGMADIGRWPWPRRYHASLVEILRQWNARAVIFDVLFSEKGDPEEDLALAEAMQKSGKVYLGAALESQKDEKVWVEPLEMFAREAKAVGHINIFPDEDGVVRRVQPFLSHGGKTYPYLPLPAAYNFLDEPIPQKDNVPFPRDQKGNLMVNWSGKWASTFEHYSYVDILRSYAAIKNGEKPAIDPSKLEGKICLIGMTAVGHNDVKPSSLEGLYPSVGLHANVINSILKNEFIYPAPRWANRLILIALGVMASVFFLILRKISSIAIGLASILFWVGTAFAIFQKFGIWFYTVQPALLVFTLFVFSAFYNILRAREEKRRLFELSISDGLTGLYVIRYFRNVLNEAVLENQTKRKPLSLILLDIDHFKKINDTYGHAAGDMVLKDVAQIMKDLTRHLKRPSHGTDVVARYGGEEFIILLRDCNMENAKATVGERLRKAIAARPFNYNGTKIEVTISLGVAELHTDEQVPDAMVHRADAALYRAKNTGRNRVCTELDVPAGDMKLAENS